MPSLRIYPYNNTGDNQFYSFVSRGKEIPSSFEELVKYVREKTAESRAKEIKSENFLQIVKTAKKYARTTLVQFYDTETVIKNF